MPVLVLGTAAGPAAAQDQRQNIGPAISASGHTSASSSVQPPSHTYSVEVPVIDSQAVIERQTVKKSHRLCEPVGNSRASSSDARVVYRGRAPEYRDESRYYIDDDYNYRDDRRYDDRRGRGVGAQILGGLIGGAIGNQFGGGNGKKALTIAGALIGSSVARGDRRAPREHTHRYRTQRYPSDSARVVERDFEPDYACRTEYRPYEVERIVGYDVTYRYNNTLYTRRVDRKPGSTLDLQISATPEPIGGQRSSAESDHQTPSQLQLDRSTDTPRRLL